MDPQTQNTEATSGRRGSSKVTWAVGIIVLLLLGAAIYVFMSSGSLPGAAGDRAVLASVNGADITQGDVKERIEHARTGLEAQGLNIDDPQTRELLEDQALQEIINEMVVLADAGKQGIVITDAEIDTQLGDIRARFETEEAFEAELEKNKFTPESLRENIRRELTIQKYVAQIASSSSLTVTAAEIEGFYNQLKGQTADLPPLAELRAEIESQLKNQKLAAAVQAAVENLRGGAEIDVKEEAESNDTSDTAQ